MKVLFAVQGEGRGHMTQAMAAAEMLRSGGHEVVGVAVGTNPSRSLPDFFARSFDVPLHVLASPGFIYRKGRSVDLFRTATRMLRDMGSYRRSMRDLDDLVARCRPDVVVNFLDPVTGLWAGTRDRAGRPPVVAVGHQFLLRHPTYVRKPGCRLQTFGLQRYVDVVGLASHRLALSFYETDDMPEHDTVVCPPLLRRAVSRLPVTRGGHIVAYVINHGYAEDIRAWHRGNPGVELHCFHDRPGAPEAEEVGNGLWFHRLHGQRFLEFMASGRGVVCTAGFESISEAAYLGKPAMVVPVEGHIEQQLNAIDACRCGLAVPSPRFDIGRLLEAAPSNGHQRFREWVDRAEGIFLGTLERVAGFRSKSRGPVLSQLPQEHEIAA